MANKIGNRGLKLMISVAGKRKTFPSIEAAAKAFKIPYNTLYQRLFIMEWSAKDALTTPVRKPKKKVVKRKKRS
jgi:hypothetical protein